MWFWLSLIALLCWSGSDLFSKIGCQGEDDHLAHLKMVIAVGTVMGLHAAFEIFIGGTEISWSIIWTYLPVSLLYIGSMTLGYLGLRYIELSVSSPICNSSGALVAVMTLLFVGGEDYSPLALGAIVLVCVGAIGLGVVDATEDPELRAARQAEGNRKYSKSFLALALPVAYCLLDAAGTFADNRVLETLDEGSANCAYELTFLFAAVLCFIYVVFIKKDRLLPKREAPKYIGAICETAGQFAYIYAIADTSHLAMSAPIVGSSGDDQIEITFDCTDGNRRLGRQKLRRLDITDWKLSATIRLHAGVIHVACSGIQNIEAVEIILNLDGKIILGAQRTISALVKPTVNKAAGFFQMTTAGTDFSCKISSQITGLGFFCAAAD